MNRVFLNFLFLSIYKDRKSHIALFLISIILIFILATTLFTSTSLKHTLFNQLNNQADFVVQKVRGGNRVDAPLSWQDKLTEIYGVSKVTPRVYGRYYFEDKKEYALIFGIDFLDEQANKELASIIKETKLDNFLESNNMIVSKSIKEYLSSHFYNDNYNFLTPSGKFIKVNIYKTLTKESSLYSNNIIIMPIDLAKSILGVEEDFVSDFTLNVANDDEQDNIYSKISSLYYDISVTTKKDVKKAYENLYNYKGGFFLLLFILTLATFLLLLYYRYSIMFYTQKRAIGIYRAIGWSIKDIIKLKFLESSLIAIFSFIIGATLAYIYTFIFNAPIIKDIFLGSSNLPNRVNLEAIIDFSTLGVIFILFVLPFIAATIVPVWKIATTNPKEAML